MHLFNSPNASYEAKTIKSTEQNKQKIKQNDLNHLDNNDSITAANVYTHT
jgi:hypothetical protein